LPDALNAELQRLGPAELLVAEPAEQHAATGAPMHDDDWRSHLNTTACPAHYFDSEAARLRLCRHFDVATLDAFGCANEPLAIAAAGAILAYLVRTNPALARLLTGLHHYDTSGFVEIDGRTWRALEAVEPAYLPQSGTAANRRAATLLDVLDVTRTAMGARLLRRTLLQPLTDRAQLEQRLDAVSELRDHSLLREHVAVALDGLADLERLSARIVHGSATPRELHALAAGLARVPALATVLDGVEAPALQALRLALDDCAEARALISTAIADPNGDDTRTIRPGFSADLDALTGSISSARAWIAALEATERQQTGIRSLKVGFTKVFGYYLEVSRPNLSAVPESYQRRQSLAHAERYVTAELKEHEAVVLHGEEQIETLERELYLDVLNRLTAYHAHLRLTSAALAQMDVWLSLATVALARGYVRPDIVESGVLNIDAGRHPIVEATMDGGEFTANDLRLERIEDSESGARVLLLTGPNMAGKSTYLRQIASIVLLAHIGSFVPARQATIGLVDRIFLRVGAEDDLARGLSTFMLEMVETAYILRHATPRSLIVLDEVGRGTSTTDGIAIARAVLEHLHDVTGARVLFATHYRELAALTATLPRLRTFRMDVAERNGAAIFLHRVVPGASDSSYGVHVARMAGLPANVTDRAAALLRAENGNDSKVAESPAIYRAMAGAGNSVDETPPRDVPTTRDEPERELTLALASLSIAAMTPLEALNVLFSLQQRALARLHANTG
ncbi:MAG: DNA mismatch repair protein MutS, partial [Ktedonobacterales bacterium]